MDDNIFRKPNEEERSDFRPLGGMDPVKEFRAKLAEEEQKCIKAGKPFAFRAAMDKFNDEIKESVERSKRKHGYVKFEELKVPMIDLKEFSDLKNFEVIEEGERSDEPLSKRNPGLDIRIKYVKYKFRDYGGSITVMEDPSNSIKRAQEKIRELQEGKKK